MIQQAECVVCEREKYAVTLTDGVCPACRCVLNAEIGLGMARLTAYLEKWARFRQWEVTHR